MAIYIVTMFFIIGWYPILKNTFNKNGKKYYCILACILLSLLIGLRHESLGMYDTEYLYIPNFKQICKMTMFEVLRTFDFFRGNGLYICTKIFTYLSTNQYLWLFVTSLPFTISFSYFVYKYSKLPSLSFFLIFGLRIYLVNFFLIRQSIAAAILIWSYEFIKNKKLIPFILTVLLASWFHTTAIVFFIAYPLVHFKIGFKQMIAILGCLYIAIYYKADFFEFIFSLFGDVYYSGYYTTATSFDTLTYFYIYLLIVGIIVILKWGRVYSEDDKIMINCLNIATGFMAFSTILAEFYRIGMFFGAFGAVALANAYVDTRFKQYRIFIYIVIIVLFGAYAIKGIADMSMYPYKSCFS